MLEVETENSDLDLLVTTFDCLLDRTKFYNDIEGLLKNCPLVKQLIVIRNANVPLAKFKFDGIKVDLVFAEMKSPNALLSAPIG